MPRFIKVRGSIFETTGKLGDFKYMSSTDTFERAPELLLLYCENVWDGTRNNRFPGCNDKPVVGAGTAVVRPLSYMFKQTPDAAQSLVAGISTGWSVYSGGYEGQMHGLKLRQFQCEMEHIKRLILDNPLPATPSDDDDESDESDYDAQQWLLERNG